MPKQNSQDSEKMVLPFDENSIGLTHQVDDALLDDNIAQRYEDLTSWKGGEKPSMFKKGGFSGVASRDPAYAIAGKTPGIGTVLGLQAVGTATQAFLGKVWGTAKNLLARRKTKSNLIKLGAMGLAVGAVIAVSILVPPVGLMFVAVGSALTFGMAGGTIALGIGAAVTAVVAGSLAFQAGEKLAAKVAADEKYELSQNVVDKFDKSYSLDEETVSLMNRYILNRMKSVKSARYKKDLAILQEFSIEQGSEIGLYRLARYFCTDLDRMTQSTESYSKFENDIKALEHLVNKLQNMDNVVGVAIKNDEYIKASMDRLASINAQHKRELTRVDFEGVAPKEQEQQSLSEDLVEEVRSELKDTVKHNVKDKVSYQRPKAWMPAPTSRNQALMSQKNKAPLSKEKLDEIDERFHKDIDEHHQALHISEVTRTYNAQNISDLNSGKRSVEYHFKTTDDVKIPTLTKEESMAKSGGYKVSSYMELKEITIDNRQRCIDVLAVQAKSFSRKDSVITLHPVEDDDFTVDLCVAMQKHGLSVELNSEFINKGELEQKIEEKLQVFAEVSAKKVFSIKK